MTKLIVTDEMLTRMTDAERLERLWAALSWLDTYDPIAVADMENGFGFNVYNRTVNAHDPRGEEG